MINIDPGRGTFGLRNRPQMIDKETIRTASGDNRSYEYLQENYNAGFVVICLHAPRKRRLAMVANNAMVTGCGQDYGAISDLNSHPNLW